MQYSCCIDLGHYLGHYLGHAHKQFCLLARGGCEETLVKTVLRTGFQCSQAYSCASRSGPSTWLGQTRPACNVGDRPASMYKEGMSMLNPTL